MKIETKLSKNGAAHATELTLDFKGVSAEKLQEWATRTVVISWQRVARDAGKIPPKDHVLVNDFMDGKGRPGRQVTPEKILASAEKMDPAQVADLIKRLQAVKAAPKSPTR